MRAIFVSYRRSDSQGEAGRLFDDLTAHFGEQAVFMDVAGIEAGRDFRKAIDESISSCGVLLVVVGPGWVDAKDETGARRLDDAADFVRVEVSAALARDIPVIPVLVRGAVMPRVEQLPDSLKNLAYRNGVELTHARWKSDLQLLLNPLRRLVGASSEIQARTGSGEPRSASRPDSVQAASAATPQPSTFDPAFLQKVSRELAVEIGPIADVVVKRAALECQSKEDLCRKVAEEIESARPREAFLHRVDTTSSLAKPVVHPPVPEARSPAVQQVSKPADTPSEAAQPGGGSAKLMPIAIAAAIVLLVLGIAFGKKVFGPEVASSPAGASASSRRPDQPPGGAVNEGASPAPKATEAAVSPGSTPDASPKDPQDAAAVARRATLSGDVAKELLISRVVPTYPPLARQAHIQGAVVLAANISRDGMVESLRTVSGHPMLVPAAIDAVKQWRYKPYLLGGTPVPVQTQVMVNFSLTNPETAGTTAGTGSSKKF